MPTSTKVRVPQESGTIRVSRGGVELKTFTVTDHTISPATKADLALALTITGAVADDGDEPAEKTPAKRTRRSRVGRTPTGAEDGDTPTGDDDPDAGDDD